MSKLHKRRDEAVPGDNAPHGHFTEQLERLAEPSAPPEEPHQRGPRVGLAVEQAALENVRMQLRGTAGGGGRRGEDRREGERGRGDAGSEHAREEREGVAHATGTGAGGDEGVEEGRGERRARTRHPVEQAAAAAWGRWSEARGAGAFEYRRRRCLGPRRNGTELQLFLREMTCTAARNGPGRAGPTWAGGPVFVSKEILVFFGQ